MVRNVRRPGARAREGGGRGSVIGVALMLAALAGCSGGGSSAPQCQVSSVSITPTAVTDLSVGDSRTLSASISSSNCSPAPTVQWSVSPAGPVTLTANGNSATVTGVTPTASPVTVSAKAASATGTILVSVVSASQIALSPTQLDFFSWVGGDDPPQATVTITNSGGGTLTGLSVGTITYGAKATGWITIASLSSSVASPSSTLQVQATTGSLAAGTYTATLPIQAPAAENSPQSIAVTFTIGADNPCDVVSALPIAIGDQVNGSLAPSDCPLGDGTYLDGYALTITSPVTLQVDLTSTAFDAYLFLAKEDADSLIVVDANDDRDQSTTDAQMVDDYLPGVYYIIANSYDANGFGPYTLTVTQLAPGIAGARVRGSAGLLTSKAVSLRRLRFRR